MNEDTTETNELECTEEQTFIIEISDEALEAACCGEKITFTFSFVPLYCGFC
jgi:hypothetical protein